MPNLRESRRFMVSLDDGSMVLVVEFADEGEAPLFFTDAGEPVEHISGNEYRLQWSRNVGRELTA